jgi:predicted dinucleotide-binding enzyme
VREHRRSRTTKKEHAVQDKPTIAVIGGTGDLGSGLARLWAAAGYRIVIGSRAKDKAVAAAEQLRESGAPGVRGDDNLAAAQAGDIIVLAVP